jgi:glutathione S-transferase
MTSPAPAIRLNRFALSGHCHRVELFLSLLGLPFEAADIDLMKGAHQTPEFLAKNPFGQVPVMEDGGTVLSDSNAILVYLALSHDPAGAWLPRDPLPAAQVQQWLSVAAGPLTYGPNDARLAKLFGVPLDYERASGISLRLYQVLDPHLSTRAFLVGEAPTIADIAIYSYTALAGEGGISLEEYPHIRQWLARIEALPGFVPMPRSQPAAATA